MAIMQVAYSVVDNPELFDIICDSFDSVQEVRDEPYYQRKVLRVQHEEITKDDIVIDPEVIMIPGIKPFIISFNV